MFFFVTAVELKKTDAIRGGSRGVYPPNTLEQVPPPLPLPLPSLPLPLEVGPRYCG